MDANKFKRIVKQIEDAMAAVSFAEEGEQTEAASLFQRERRVLLALKEGHIDPRTFKYALNAAQRIAARLDILYVRATSRKDRSDEQLLGKLESNLLSAGINYRFITRSGCMKQEIIDHTNQDHEVLFVVVESPGSLDADCGKADGVLTELWKNLRCPLVVVADHAGA